MNNTTLLDISIVLPCYNSAKEIPISLKLLSDFIHTLNRKFEIIISDDGSTDETQSLNWDEYSHLFNSKYIRNDNNKGKGEALRNGFNSCVGKFIFLMDIDLPVELDALSRALHILERNEADLVIGDRRVNGSIAIGAASIERFVASKVFNLGVQFIALPGYLDTQCPMKGFESNKLKSILSLSFLTSFAFDAELIYLFKIKGYNVKNISVTWKDVRSSMPFLKLTCIVLACLIDVSRVRLKSSNLFHK